MFVYFLNIIDLQLFAEFDLVWWQVVSAQV